MIHCINDSRSFWTKLPRWNTICYLKVFSEFITKYISFYCKPSLANELLYPKNLTFLSFNVFFRFIVLWLKNCRYGVKPIHYVFLAGGGVPLQIIMEIILNFFKSYLLFFFNIIDTLNWWIWLNLLWYMTFWYTSRAYYLYIFNYSNLRTEVRSIWKPVEKKYYYY